MSPKLSVVVPFYGVEEYIGACLATIRDQTLGDFECLLVDDGSLDGSRAVAERFVDADPRFRLVTQANAGLGAARNTGARHATGEYLMFVDSDDLLAPRCFQQLVTTLDRTGSDFAGGNVWRSSLRWGLVVSEAHKAEFAEHRERVTIADVPLLMRDRMIWNKAYRRSFWDAHGYAFPEMRYEDYPVTLRAHLEASAVDLLADPLYVWREREAGTSISQQTFDIANVRDRVRAVHLVLDLVDALATPEVAELVDSYFVQVDLKECMSSLLTVPDADQDELERLILSVADRIRPERTGHAPAFTRAFHRAARGRDWALARALARWQAGQGLAGLRAELPRVPSPRQAAVAAWLLASVNDVNPLHTRRLESEPAVLAAAGDRYEGTVDIRLRQRVAGAARVTVTAGRAVLPSRVEPHPRGLRVFFTAVAGAGEWGPLRVRAAAGPLRWAGPVALAEVPPAVGLPGRGRLQAAVRERTLHLAWLAEPVVADEVRCADGVLAVHLSGPPAAELHVRRPYPDAPVAATVDAAGWARFGTADLVAGDPPDNPVDHVAWRPLVARAPGGGEAPVLQGCAEAECPAAAGERPVAVRVGPDGHAHVVHRDPEEAA